MIKQSVLKEVVEQQLIQLNKTDLGYKRHLLMDIDVKLQNYALIVSGIRRCGKSTVLHQIKLDTTENTFFLNFDTPKLFTFALEDFALLDEIILNASCNMLFLDEIQVINGWELWVRQKLDEGYQVIVTGSNASLLSKELGTKLTGRHITKELFPFSYHEFCEFKGLSIGAISFSHYLNLGGLPEYIKTENIDIHTSLFDDILYRDVAVRHNIRDVQSLKKLLIFLATNIGNLVSATKLIKILGIKSSATIMEYFSFFEQSYLIQLMPRFSYSYKVQLVNPRKVYFIDNGLQNSIASSFNTDLGRKLENTVFWELRRQQKELYYFNENGKECDFVVCKNNKTEQLIQVCFTLNAENENREIDALLEAMKYFNLEEGTIITYDQHDVILLNGKRISVIPAYEFFTTKSIVLNGQQ